MEYSCGAPCPLLGYCERQVFLFYLQRFKKNQLDNSAKEQKQYCPEMMSWFRKILKPQVAQEWKLFWGKYCFWEVLQLSTADCCQEAGLPSLAILLFWPSTPSCVGRWVKSCHSLRFSSDNRKRSCADQALLNKRSMEIIASCLWPRDLAWSYQQWARHWKLSTISAVWLVSIIIIGCCYSFFHRCP